MNKKPVSYLQIDSRWKNISYSAKGESTTIGKSGCGPTSAAMLISTLTGKTVLPTDTCKWALEHGYKAPNQGTYYSYFVPQFKAYNISCTRLNTVSIYGNKTSDVHAKAFDLIKQGYYVIACMGKGTWTSSGHYIVVWWEDGKVRINDPNSTASYRLNGDLNTFKSQVKYYWAIDSRAYNNVSITSGKDDTVTVTLSVLKQGSKCEEVKTLQRLLTAMGYSTNGIDGSFGNNTLLAIKKFQTANKLTSDGIVGQATWNALLK